MPARKKTSQKTLNTIDAALQAIIDQWYCSISDYYLTAEKKVENPQLEGVEELKRFHDETGHRIKFNKGELNFTYGLSVQASADGCAVEVSVNNKVPQFNYGELVRRLSAYYETARTRPLGTAGKQKKLRNCDLFSLADDLQASVSVEQRDGKADILRLSFDVLDNHLEDVIADPPALMEAIHEYCVAPLRRCYAEVYRIKQRK